MINKLKTAFTHCDAILITSPHNLRYFTGFSGGEGVALATKEKSYLFVDSRYTMAAKEEVKDFEVIEYSTGRKEIFEELSKISLLGYEDAFLTVKEFASYKKVLKNTKWYECSNVLEGLRMVKTEREIELLKKAESISVQAFTEVLPFIKEGVSEIEIASELEYRMRKKGAEGISFDTIVVSGYKSGMPHGRPDEKLIQNGDFVTMDFGCIYKGYCSDMTRTVVVGKADAGQKKIYNIVKEAQRRGLEAICEGKICSDIDAVSRDYIAQEGYGDYFGHSLGHGVGLCIHEMPNLSAKSDIVLKEGMVVTCEPGIYLANGGVRIEDMVLVTKNGCVNFTDFPKELIEI